MPSSSSSSSSSSSYAIVDVNHPSLGFSSTSILPGNPLESRSLPPSSNDEGSVYNATSFPSPPLLPAHSTAAAPHRLSPLPRYNRSSLVTTGYPIEDRVLLTSIRHPDHGELALWGIRDGGMEGLWWRECAGVRSGLPSLGVSVPTRDMEYVCFSEITKGGEAGETGVDVVLPVDTGGVKGREGDKFVWARNEIRGYKAHILNTHFVDIGGGDKGGEEEAQAGSKPNGNEGEEITQVNSVGRFTRLQSGQVTAVFNDRTVISLDKGGRKVWGCLPNGREVNVTLDGFDGKAEEEDRRAIGKYVYKAREFSIWCELDEEGRREYMERVKWKEQRVWNEVKSIEVLIFSICSSLSTPFASMMATYPS
ncbi:hypothetical protein TrRE_jg6086 [Triparma retinervis]|uniref:Uncharacterized protein n=1 Tax=Triparma retinervis TaxID=2557542 RepID=A0A9W7A3U4_9STRA|nr:hypothetical protein TrRE_jg6086 [Triparma retinervis]